MYKYFEFGNKCNGLKVWVSKFDIAIYCSICDYIDVLSLNRRIKYGTLLNLVGVFNTFRRLSSVFRSPSGSQLTFFFIFLTIVSPKQATTPGGSSVNFTVIDDAETSLDDFCSWQAQLSYDDDTNPDDWDLAILFTGYGIKNTIYSGRECYDNVTNHHKSNKN